MTLREIRVKQAAEFISKSEGYFGSDIRALAEDYVELYKEYQMLWDTPGGKRLYAAFKKIQELEKQIEELKNDTGS